MTRVTADDSTLHGFCSEGPWGSLRYDTIVLQPVADDLRGYSAMTETIEWDFPEPSWREVVSRLQSFGFSDSQILQIEQKGEMASDSEGTVVWPPTEVVFSMAHSQRTALYQYLWDRGIYDASFMLEETSIEMMENSPLDPEVVNWVKSFSYRYRGGMIFSDAALVLRNLEGQEKLEFISTLSKTRGLMLHLKIDETTDVEALAKYWSIDGKDASVTSILRSVRDTPGSEWIDVAHLLGPFGRKYLNTYTQLDDVRYSEAPDCFWSVINFSSWQPHSRYLDRIEIDIRLPEISVPVDPPYQFGDMLLLISEDRKQFIHSYIYIADDIVFTKNGKSVLYPWMLMKEEDMLSRYRHEPFRRFAFRPRTAIGK